MSVFFVDNFTPDRGSARYAGVDQWVSRQFAPVLGGGLPGGWGTIPNGLALPRMANQDASRMVQVGDLFLIWVSRYLDANGIPDHRKTKNELDLVFAWIEGIVGLLPERPTNPGQTNWVLLHGSSSSALSGYGNNPFTLKGRTLQAYQQEPALDAMLVDVLNGAPIGPLLDLLQTEPNPRHLVPH
ncbi:MAG: hypothetical protein ABL962_10300 [Fimbriimonadaceae bacterium]